MSKTRNETLTILEKKLEKKFADPSDRRKVQYILTTLEFRRLESMVETMVFNHILKLFTIPDPENRKNALFILFEQILNDMFSSDGRKYHLSNFEAV